MTSRGKARAIAAAGAVFDRFGWPWRTERRSRHQILIVTLPTGVDHNIIITDKRDGSGTNLAVWHARRLLTKHGLKP